MNTGPYIWIKKMSINITTPALLFPAITLLELQISTRALELELGDMEKKGAIAP